MDYENVSRSEFELNLYKDDLLLNNELIKLNKFNDDNAENLGNLLRVIRFYMLDYKFLKSININKEDMREYLAQGKFFYNLSKIVLSDTKVTAKFVYEISRCILTKMPGTVPRNLLDKTYEYLVFKNFPESVKYRKSVKNESCMMVFIQLLRAFYDYEQLCKKMDEFSTFDLLKGENLNLCKDKYEYLVFYKKYRNNYVYEMFKLSEEVLPFNTFEHIAGVNHVAMYIAKQLKKLDITINLSIVAGASISHDIGKYGCKKEESGKVPYYHYYYTHKWFTDIDAPVISNIAANHSTWDLELENLSLESLILIYSDFRVKNRFENEKQIMTIYNLDDSFKVILNKLDNVDDKKEKRYIRVYNKLKDFEDFLISIGVNTDLKGVGPIDVEKKDYALMYGNDVIDNLKYMAIKQNISLMSKLIRNVGSLSNMIETAKTDSNYSDIRSYLNIFDEYSTYLTQGQKLVTLNFMYELMTFKHGDVRRQSAQILGKIIANFDEKYRKELPQGVRLEANSVTSIKLFIKFLDKIIDPGLKTTNIQKVNIREELSTFIRSVFDNVDKDLIGLFLDTFIDKYKNSRLELELLMPMLKASRRISFEILDSNAIEKLYKFSLYNLNNKNEEVKLSALFTLRYLQKSCKLDVDMYEFARKIEFKKNDSISIKYVKNSILTDLKQCGVNIELLDNIEVTRKDISGIYLDNLKFATPAINKVVNINLLSDYMDYNESLIMQTATHFSNLVKVSEKSIVRRVAGEALLELAPKLTDAQKNEISVELFKGLEIDSIEFSKYLPRYLGQFVLNLKPSELDEIVLELKLQYKNGNERSSALYLDTVGIIISQYEKYKDNFSESKKEYDKRLVKLLGILMSGLSSYKESVKREAIFVLGKYIFATDTLSSKFKKKIFENIYKKLLTLVSEKEQSEIFFFHSAASFNHIYRYISDYIFKNGNFNFNENKKVAFFPGTFDPFSLSHKGIADHIRDLGFDVYLSIDEFSWSKRTQPNLVRRQIVSMSIAEEKNIYLFPDDISINISNQRDMGVLNNLFEEKKLYIVVGSDVVANASAYKNKPTKNSIHNFNHVVFDRISEENGDENSLNNTFECILGDVVNLKLPAYLEDISSTRIRENIDKNRDISYLIDLGAQNYIYDKGLYLGEPQYKGGIRIKALDVSIIKNIDRKTFLEICKFSPDFSSSVPETYFEKNPNLLYIIDENHHCIVGGVLFHKISTNQLYEEFKSMTLAVELREYMLGEIHILDGFFFDSKSEISDLKQIIINEILAYLVSKNGRYIIYNNAIEIQKKDVFEERLELQGFKKVCDEKIGVCLHTVNIKSPITLVLDVESFIKDAIIADENVRDVIKRTRKKLKTALAKLYSGHLLLILDNDLIQHKIVKKVCEINKVPSIPVTPILRGENMCVPFGSNLKGKVVANTVTKSIHTDKVFFSDLSNFNINEYPFYSPLENQVRTVESFNKPVILVDDLLNKGYRLKVLSPLFKKYDISVKMVIVGILSSRGKDLMIQKGRDVFGAYFIPNLKNWLNEDLMYPFIGGDTMDRGGIELSLNIVPSINLILPYVYPKFMKDLDESEIYEFSRVCLENARDIMKAVERAYQQLYERKLTVKRLGEVMISPRIPDKGEYIEYDVDIEPSRYIENDIDLLKRLKK